MNYADLFLSGALPLNNLFGHNINKYPQYQNIWKCISEFLELESGLISRQRQVHKRIARSALSKRKDNCILLKSRHKTE